MTKPTTMGRLSFKELELIELAVTRLQKQRLRRDVDNILAGAARRYARVEAEHTLPEKQFE